MDFTDHSKANTTIVTTSGQHMCHLFLCTYQQHPAHSVFTARSQISPSLLCCEIETVERTEEKEEFDRSIKNKPKHFICTHPAQPRGASLGGPRPGLNYTLHTAADERTGRGTAHLLETADWREVCSCLLRWSLPSHTDKRWSTQLGPPWKERGTGWGLDWQKDWRHPISCYFPNMYSHLDNGRLLPKPCEKEASCSPSWLHFSSHE